MTCYFCPLGGICFAYNADLFYRDIFPNYDLGWWLFFVTFVVGSTGVIAGGIVSDKVAAKMGIRSRVAVLAISQVSIFTDPGGIRERYKCWRSVHIAEIPYTVNVRKINLPLFAFIFLVCSTITCVYEIRNQDADDV